MPQGGALQVEEEEENNKEEEEGKVDKEEEDAEPLPASRWACRAQPQVEASSAGETELGDIKEEDNHLRNSEEMRGLSLPRLHQVTRCTAAPDQLLAIL